MKSVAFISVLFLSAVNTSGISITHENELLAINQPNHLSVKPQFFIDKNLNAFKLSEYNKYDLSFANNKNTNSVNNILLLQLYFFNIKERIPKIKIVPEKINCKINHNNPKSIIIKPNVSLVKAPP